MQTEYTLIVLLVVPLLLAIISGLIPKGILRLYSIFSALFFLTLTLFFTFGTFTAAGTTFEQSFAWLPLLGSGLTFRLDSISVWFVILNAITTVIAISLNGNWYRKNPRLFVVLGFFLTGILNGAFLSSDLVSFYLFYEAVFIPMIFMVGVWGKKAKASAVLRFFLMSLSGSILMLVSIFYLSNEYFVITGHYSTQITDLLQVTAGKQTPEMLWCFLGFFLAFAIKVPVIPFHGWLKEVYTLAPMPATIWMSAILSKLGVFGFLRFVVPLFPEIIRFYQSELLWLSAGSIVYAALLAIKTDEPKTLLAYSSISHLGFLLMGLFSMQAGSVQSIVILSAGHTLVSAALFYILQLVQDRAGEINLNKEMGLIKKYPVLFVICFVMVLAGVSLPGSINFVGEFLVLFQAFASNKGSVVFGGIGVILGAIYMLKFYQKMALGECLGEEKSDSTLVATKDIELFDIILLSVILLLIIGFGFQPALILKGGV